MGEIAQHAEEHEVAADLGGEAEVPAMRGDGGMERRIGGEDAAIAMVIGFYFLQLAEFIVKSGEISWFDSAAGAGGGFGFEDAPDLAHVVKFLGAEGFDDGAAIGEEFNEAEAG